MLKTVKGVFASLLLAVPALSITTFSATSAHASIVNVSTVDRTNPTVVTETALNNALDVIKQFKNVSKDNQALRQQIKANVLPLFHTDYIALSLLNTYARTATKEQLVEFRNVIEDYMVNAFVEAMTLYSNQTFKVGTTSVVQNTATTNVALQNGNQTINIIFRLVNLNNKYGIVDFSAEGISLVNTKATEWQPILRQSGVAGLIQYVKTHMDDVLGDINKAQGTTK
ncbi:MlaC/ttg2D family ABC transporter substrate-binding protein [Psittacicella gerlachiana]|uniref:Uncharacterized protein n=1 Tax=Psittacicella gerlachiana TaxID=2028574 RepID=A0A3A1Y9M4_9GAMM|nr:ABC transporter substrate-binding protein [Psittacicella gerlachiana]RIY33919.1 hypothetical protein CKF59_06035 [Psittacicella gerlachiana]